jgi:hypothetical protein
MRRQRGRACSGSRRVGSVAVAVAFGLAWPRTLAAAEPGFATAAGRVELVMAAAGDDFGLLERTIRETIAGRDLELVSSRKEHITPNDVLTPTPARTGDTAPVVARVLLDLGTRDAATLYLIDSLRRRVHVRRLPLENGFDTVARESVLFVVERSLEAILAGQEIGVSWDEYQRSVEPAPIPPVETPPPPPPPPPPPLPRRVSLAAGYEASAMGAGAYLHGPRVMLGVRIAKVRIGGALRLQAPLTVGDETAAARLSAGGGALSIASTLFAHRGFSVAGGLGAGLDATRIAPTVSSADLQPTPAFWAGSLNVRAFTELEQRFGRLSLAITIGLEVYPLAERYNVAAADGLRTVFVPHRVRPVVALLAGVSF